MTSNFEVRELVPLDQPKGARKPCRYCGGATGYLTPPSGPHANGVRCCDCDRHLGWLPDSRDDCDLIES